MKKRTKIATAKILKLTKNEERLLMYPPNEDTWECTYCKMVVPGTWDACNWCRRKKTDKAQLVYPRYLTACEKVGIVPGSGRWRYKEGTKIPMRFLTGANKWTPIEEETEA